MNHAIGNHGQFSLIDSGARQNVAMLYDDSGALKLTKIFSGGQSGVDRAALDWAIRIGIPHGGWCPRGRLASDGVLSDIYRLNETESAGYRQRTKLNVQDSDGTLILNEGEMSGGTRLTQRFAVSLSRPWLVVALDVSGLEDSAARVRSWISEHGVSTLNIAGPSEGKRPGIYSRAMKFLEFIGDSLP